MSSLKRLRIEAELSQEGLAEKSRVDTAYISLLERKMRTPTVPVAARITRALSHELGREVTIYEVFDEEGAPGDDHSSQATRMA